MSIQTQQVNVTPEQAHTWLEEHYKRIEAKSFLQRPVTPAVVNRYAADMLQGAWLLCPQPIIFDESGNLLDGQHRLEAVRKSKVTIKAIMSTGWPNTGNGRLTTMDTIDRGKPRNLGQILHLHGYTNASNYASCISTIGRLVNFGSCSISLAGTMFVLDELDMRSHIDKIMLKSQSSKDFVGRVVGPLAYYHTYAPRKAEEFAEHAFNFTAAKGSAVSSYLRWCKANSGAHVRDYMVAMAVCLRAWHANEDLSMVRLNVEAATWLVNNNDKLRDNIRKAIPRTR